MRVDLCGRWGGSHFSLNSCGHMNQVCQVSAVVLLLWVVDFLSRCIIWWL